jgi:MoaA/NifB/PqqE/SkfB family radical SAM enzyme
MPLVQRLAKHARLNWQSLAFPDVSSPPFLVLFINSLCNMKCEHCFYWQQLNQPDDLTVEELVKLSEELGPIQNLNLSGGEPFLRNEFGQICRQFIRKNQVKEIYVPTNGYFTDKTITQIREVLKEPSLQLFAVELSLDGMQEFHDTFRVTKNSFRKSMETYDALEELQREHPRLQIHSISTATQTNMDEIRRLTTYLFDRCPNMSHHNLALIRGDRKNPTLQGPALQEYQELYQYVRRLWAPREQSRYGSYVEPMLQWAKVKTAQEQRQVIPCRAGILTAVIHANGDVALCEQHAPIGNLRRNSFMQIWHSDEARKLRASIKAKECYCTNEIFMWSSIAYQPLELARAMLSARPWKHFPALADNERADWQSRLGNGSPPNSANRISLPILAQPK